MPREIDCVYIHHSASPRDTTTIEEIRDWHVKGNGWKDIGYHYVISSDGSIEIGRPLDEVGAHVRGYNFMSAGICLTGNFMEEEPTSEQLQSLDYLLGYLYRLIHFTEVKGHRDAPDQNTECPGDNLYNKLVDIRKVFDD